LRCWGANDYGQLGEGNKNNRGDAPDEMGENLPTIDLGEIPMDVAAGLNHVCAILMNDQLKCWGSNASGQLGLGDTQDRGDEPAEMGTNLSVVKVNGTALTVKKISAGNDHTCAILSNDQVKCWGANAYGQLGLEDEMTRLAPAATDIDLGLNPTTNQKATVKAIASGRIHNCAILDDGRVKCWGSNGGGQLGLGHTMDWGGSAGQMGDALLRVDLGDGRTAVEITAWNDQTCALLDNGALKCWGKNNYGQLGTGDKGNRGASSDTMGNNLLPIDLGMGRTAKSVGVANYFVCALLDDTSVKCWGYGMEGNLGLGASQNLGDEPNEMGINLPIVKLFSDKW
jgi:E3 ubiquitin-protein ligase HERC3